MTSRDNVLMRSGGRCEAMILLPSGVYTRCWKEPVEVHHMLTRARGGRVLDEIGETYHLICLCNSCHRNADGGQAYEDGMLIDGYVMSHPDGSIEYVGTDEYLKEKYGKSDETSEESEFGDYREAHTMASEVWL